MSKRKKEKEKEREREKRRRIEEKKTGESHSSVN